MKIVKMNARTRAEIISDTAIGLTPHLEGIARGKEPTPRSPLYNNSEGVKSEEWVKSQWQAVLDASLSQTYPILKSYEDSRWVKFGAQGGYPPLSERWEKLSAYWTPNRWSVSQRFKSWFKRRKPELVTALFPAQQIHRLRPLSYENVLTRDSSEDKLITNAGLPLWVKRRTPQAINQAIDAARNDTWQMYPAVVGSRSQRGKDRFIFMFPFCTNLVEKTFVLPTMDAIRQKAPLSFSAWEGFDEVEIAITKQYRQLDLPGWWISMDYTAMDTTMKQEQMEIVFEVVRELFQEQFHLSLRESMFHCLNIPVLAEPNSIIYGVHGLASGSGWTNLAESIYSFIIHRYIEETMGINFSVDQLLGDDGAYVIPDPTRQISADALTSVVERCSADAGLVASKEKQRVEYDGWFVYLQRWFSSGYERERRLGGAYPTVLALNAGMHPERFHSPKTWSNQMEILRWVSILENCKHHPLFLELIHFFEKGDKFRLGLNLPGFWTRDYRRAWSAAKQIKGLIPSYNNSLETRGIDDFEVVKILRKEAIK